MERSGFRDLEVWKSAKKLAVEVYELTNQNSFMKDFSLRDQIRRAVISIPSNIAEGDERSSNKESVRFFYIAKGSLAELMTQLEIAKDINYISNEQFNIFFDKFVGLGRRLGALINVRNNKINSNKTPITYNP